MSDSVLECGEPAAVGEIDDEQLRGALREANLPTVLLVLAHLTGDHRWLAEPYRPRRGHGLGDNDTAGLSEQLQEEVRAAAYEVVIAYRTGELAPVTDPAPERIAQMLECALDEEVPLEYGQLLGEEMGLISRDVDIPQGPGRNDLNVVIIGAGLSGLAMAIKLQAAGIDFTVLEKDPDIGGTWLENTYPGCGVDTPSHLYSFSFAPNTQWSRYFAKRGEVFDYLSRIADQYDLRRNVRFGTEVVRVDFEEATSTWRVQIRQKGGAVQTLTTRILISAVGMVNRPSTPPISGLADFEGPLMHTARWQDGTDLRDKHVAVIGTGASAMQLVPAIADDARTVTVFQRSKQWALPHPNYHRGVSPGVRYLMDEMPFYAKWYRLRAFWNFSDRLHASLQIDPEWEHPERSINATNERHRVFLTKHMQSELGHRAAELLPACLPDYPPYVKRPLLDNGWFRTVSRDDVELVTDEVARVTSDAVVTVSGERHDADVIVLATGFKTLQFLWPMEIRGRSGQTLREQWGVDDARAYLGVAVPDHPNFFILNGPNTNAGHGGSAVLAVEFQVRYIMQALRHFVVTEADTVEVDLDVFRRYNNELDDALGRSIWSHTGGTTYYRNSAGRVVVSSPWKYIDYWQRTRTFDPAEYHTTQRSGRPQSLDAGDARTRTDQQ